MVSTRTVSDQAPAAAAAVPSRPRRRPAAAVGLRSAWALALGLLVAALPAATATADDDVPGQATAGAVTFGIAPSSAQGPTSRTSLEYFLAPGTSLTDYVGVTNFSAQDVELAVYAADASQTPAGDYTLDPADVTPTDIASWVQIDPTTYVVPARTRLDIPFLLTVPDDAAPGDHAGGIVASLTTGQGTVEVENRVGVRLQAQVAGELDPDLVVEDLRTSYSPSWIPFTPGTLTVDYTIRNEGNVRLAASQAVTTTGLLGITAARPEVADVPELLPGSTLDVRVQITGVAPLGRLTTDVSLLPVARPEIALEPQATPATSHAVWAVPWSSIAALLLVGLLVWALVRLAGGRAQRRALALERALAKAREQGRAEARSQADAATGAPTRRSVARGTEGQPGVAPSSAPPAPPEVDPAGPTGS